MQRIARLYRKLIYSFCVLAGLLIVMIVLMIIANVLGRTTGAYSLDWVSAASEYILQLSTMLAAPWILRQKGHIFMVVAHDVLPSRFQMALEKAVYLLCLVLCWGITWFAIKAAVHAFTSNAIDMRSVDIPGWILYASLVSGFGLMGVEFARFLFGSDSMFDADQSPTQGL